MKSVPSSIATELHKLAADSSVLYLLEIVAPAETYYLARNVDDVVWNGHTWSKMWFEIQAIPESSSGETPELFIYTSNIGGFMEQEVIDRSLFDDTTCTIYFINSSYLTETEPIFSATFNVAKITADNMKLGMKLNVDNPYLQAFPSWRLHGSLCQYPTFKEARCGYVGAETTCDRTITRCIALGNQARFGGQLGLFEETQDLT